jgi:hypothetical protein
MKSHDSMTEFPVRQVIGLRELLWTLRYRRWKRHSQHWKIIPGRIEGREFLRWAPNAGWFAVVYSYKFDESMFGGELRKWIISKKTDAAESDPSTIDFSRLFPPSAQISVKVDPEHPNRSVVDLK